MDLIKKYQAIIIFAVVNIFYAGMLYMASIYLNEKIADYGIKLDLMTTKVDQIQVRSAIQGEQIENIESTLNWIVDKKYKYS